MPKPDWLRIRLPDDRFFEVKDLLAGLRVNTVCVGAHCPNITTCWGCGTAAFMILGNICTRHCGFCAVKTARAGEPVEASEPGRIAGAVTKLGLKYVVLTSVTRDDLPDGGASQFASCIEALRERDPSIKAEVLVPDYGSEKLETIIASRPTVIGHNLESVRSLQSRVRDSRASYEKSLSVLREIKRISPSQLTKSSLMVGLGETQEELVEAMRDLRSAGVDLLTIGQYLQPSPHHLEVQEYVPPQRFDDLKEKALEIGFKAVAAGPFVRSSYKASELIGAATPLSRVMPCRKT